MLPGAEEKLTKIVNGTPFKSLEHEVPKISKDVVNYAPIREFKDTAVKGATKLLDPAGGAKNWIKEKVAVQAGKKGTKFLMKGNQYEYHDEVKVLGMLERRGENPHNP